MSFRQRNDLRWFSWYKLPKFLLVGQLNAHGSLCSARSNTSAVRKCCPQGMHAHKTSCLSCSNNTPISIVTMIFFSQKFQTSLFQLFSTNEYSYFAYFQMLSLANFQSASFYFLPTFPTSFCPFVLKPPPYLLNNLILGPSVNVINVVFNFSTRP